MPESTENKPELYFGINNPDKVEIEHIWYQDNLDIVVPVLIILTG